MAARTQTTLDFDAIGAEAGVDLEAAFAELAAFYEEVDARNRKNTQGVDLPCQAGCAECCHESVFLTPLEFFYLWRHAEETLSAPERRAIIDVGQAIYTAQRERIDALLPGRGTLRDVDEVAALARDIRFTCPFLSTDDGMCRVYSHRELFARLFGCSFNDDGGIYGCHLVGNALADQTLTLLSARNTGRALHALPLCGMRQVFPFYLSVFFD